MNTFSPFGKVLDNVESKDLSLLSSNKVSEGWYIDYKRQIPKDLAKYISSFSNRNGGWIILGVEEENREIKSFIGIDNSLLDETLNSISIACTAQCSPPISFNHKVFHGPIDDISLEAERFIVVVEIPESTHPPHIHKSGNIYLRYDHESKPLKDRHDLDRLYEKEEKTNLRINSFIENNKTKHEDSFIELFFLSKKSINHLTAKKTLSYEEVNNVLSSGVEPLRKHCHIPYNSIYSSLGGFTARQDKGTNHHNLPLTFRWWNAGECRVTIPLIKTSISHLKPKTKREIKFKEIVETHFTGGVEILDLGNTLEAIIASYAQYRTLLNSCDIKEEVAYIFNVSKAGKAVPYLDSENYLQNIKKNGLPFLQDEEIQVPASIAVKNLIYLHEEEVEEEKNTSHYLNEVSLVIMEVLISLGLSTSKYRLLEIYDALNVPYSKDFELYLKSLDDEYTN